MNLKPRPYSAANTQNPPKLDAIVFTIDGVEFTYNLLSRRLDFSRNYASMSYHTFGKVVDYVETLLVKIEKS